MAVAQDLMRLGYPVFTELGDSSRVDLIALVGDIPVKIQVKCNFESVNHSSKLSLFKSGPGYGYFYKETDCDVFALYNMDRDIISYIGWNDLRDTQRVTVRYEQSKNKQQKGIRMYTEFLDFHKALQNT